MTELFINDVLVDTQKAEIALTLQAFAFDSLGTRKGSFSNVFDLAKSNSNRALFDNCDIVTSLTNLPYQKNRCQIFIDGILIVEGSAIILETKENYRVSISAGNSDFFKLIGSLKLVDVPLQDYDHVYNGANVYPLRESISGFVYPNIDYGYLQHADLVNQELFTLLQPSFWSKTILETTFDSFGYTVKGDLINSLTYNNSVVLCRGAVANINNDAVQYGHNIEFNQLSGTTEEKINFPRKIKDAGNKYKNNVLAGQFTFEVSDDVDFLNISLTGKVITNAPFTYQNARVWIDVLVYDINGNIIQIIENNIKFENRTFGFFNTYKRPDSGLLEREINFVYSRGSISVNNDNTQIGFRVRSERPSIGLSRLKFENLEFSITQKKKVGFLNFGLSVEASNVLPTGVTVGDLLITLANLEGILIQVDEVSKVIHTAKIDKLITNKAKSLDWSDRLDLTIKPEIGYQIKGFAQRNFYKFAGDDKDPFLPPLYGQSEVLVNDLNLDSEKVIFESKFSPVPLSATLNNTRSMGAVFTGEKYDYDGFNYTLKEDAKVTDFSPRIAVLSAVEPNLFPPLPFTNLINYEVNDSALSFERALNDNYNTLKAVIQNTKVVKALFLLSLRDVANIDFTIPIYVDYFGDYFYIQEIKQFKVNKRESCFVTLIKLGI